MDSRKPITALTLLNVFLPGIVFWQARQLRASREPSGHVRETPADIGVAGNSETSFSGSSDGGPSEEVALAKAVSPPADARASTTNTPPDRPQRREFDWREVESTDYRTYIANLRAIGVPEQTVRDIVVADVTQAFAARRAEVMERRYRDHRYWKSDPEEAAVRALHDRQRREVDDAMSGALWELLGADIQTPPTDAAWQRAALEQQLARLHPAKRDPTAGLLLQFADVDARIKELSDNRLATEDPDERLRIIDAYERKRAALRSLLTEEEYDFVDMTVSWTAENLRRAMTHFHPTEQEFRIIFREWRAQDENLAAIFARREPDPGNVHVFAAIARLLPPERYAQYRATWWQRNPPTPETP